MKKKPLIQLIKEAGLGWPEGANYVAQDKKDNKVIFYKKRPSKPNKDGEVWFFMIMNTLQYIYPKLSQSFARSGVKP